MDCGTYRSPPYLVTTSGDPPVFDPMSAALPLADISGVQAASRRAASAAGRSPAIGSRPPGRTRVLGQYVPQCQGMLRTQVDLVLRAVQSEADGTLSFAAVDIVDEQNLNLLRHDYPIIRTAFVRERRNTDAYDRPA
jgi:hypothetical protein